MLVLVAYFEEGTESTAADDPDLPYRCLSGRWIEAKELGAIEVEAATGELNGVEGDCATGELGVSTRAAVEDSAGEVRVKAVKDPPTSRSKSSVRVIGWEPEARGADGGPDHPAQIREHPVVVTSSQDRATCNRTLTPS